MMVTLLCGKGSPGTTTAAVAMALGWPRPVLLVEADPAGGSIGFGYGQGIDMQDRGLLGAHLAARHGDPSAALWNNVVGLAQDRWLLPGVAEPRQTSTIDYPALAGTLAGLGVDVLVDAGRFPGPGRIDALPAGSDRVLVVMRSTLAGVHTAQTAATAAIAACGATSGVVGSVIVGTGRPYPETDVGAAMRDVAPVSWCIAWDPAAAAVITDGSPVSRRWTTCPLLRSAARLATALVTGAEPQRTFEPTGAAAFVGAPVPPDIPVPGVQIEAPMPAQSDVWVSTAGRMR
jgi:hypothetical protein